MKVCFLFGHSTVPENILPKLEETIIYHYRNYQVRTLYIGNRGAFDRLALRAGQNVQKRYPDLQLYLVLSYHPSERIPDDNGFDRTYFPPLETVPKPLRIVCANRYMVDVADSIICYAKHPGNSRDLLKYAFRRQKKRPFPLDNLA